MEKLSIRSEIGKLKKVIVHEPGKEIKRMTPETSRNLLYDDILDFPTAVREHQEMTEILKLHADVYKVTDLLVEVLTDERQKEELLRDLIIEMHESEFLLDTLMPMSPFELANALILGVEKERDTLTNYLSNEKYALPPLPNLFYTRDTAIVINNHVLNASMANNVRASEAIIMRYILEHHKDFHFDDFFFNTPDEIHMNSTFEGGDILVLRDDVLAIGITERTSTQAVDQLIEKLKMIGTVKHIFAVILPKHRAMIHLDMVFTMLDTNYACIYEPAIMGDFHLGTIHIDLSEKHNKIVNVPNLIKGLQKVGIDLQPVICGGKDRVFQDREQWMCGANFFTMSPGKVIGYNRNQRTLDELAKVANIPTIQAVDVISGKVNLNDYTRYAIGFHGAELSRGGGGARCMTLPIERE